MRRFAAGAKRVWQDVRQKIPTNVQQTEPSVPLVAMDYVFLRRGLGHDPGVDTETPRCGGSLSGASQRSRAESDRLCAGTLDTWSLREVLLKADN